MRAKQISVEGVSKEKKLDIIRAVIFSDGISRRKLAEKCGVSSMTVGKVISALVYEGIVSSERSAPVRGKSTELFRASQRVKLLLFCLEKHRLSVYVTSARGDVIYESTQLLNDSIPYDANISALVTSSYDRIADTLSEGICCVSVITDDSIRAEDVSIISSVLPDLHIDLLSSKNQCTENYMRENYPGKTVAFVQTGDDVTLSLYCRGSKVGSESAVKPHRTVKSAKEIAELLVNLSYILIPDAVIVETDLSHSTPDALSVLKNEFLRKTRLSKEDAPEFILENKTSPAILSALKSAAERLAVCLSGMTTGGKE
ncbi:MAG: hypothetical protein J6Q77_03065 [Clostridia bacterium]|nr:hypothetical protein [Clostridia bacterium]